MALIRCPECGREVSDEAKSCPGCGFPLSQKVWKNEVKINTKIFGKKNIGVVGLGIVLLCIVIFNLSCAILNIEDYSVVAAIKEISNNSDTVKVNECKVYYYSPQLMEVIYEDSMALDEEAVVVFCNVRTTNSLGDIDDGEYVYLYDMEGNVITYFGIDDSLSDDIDLFVLSFLDDAEMIQWYGWHDYSSKDVGGLLNKHIDGKKVFLTSSKAKETLEDRDNLLIQYIGAELLAKECILAERHIAQINDEKLKEECKMALEETYYELGLEAYERGEFDSALEMLEKASAYSKTEALVMEINEKIDANNLEESYLQAIKDANNHNYESAKEFFEANPNYKEAAEFLALIDTAEKSKWEGYWVADDTSVVKSESHIRILARVFSYDNYDTKGVTHSISMFSNWESLNMPYFQEHFGGSWKEEESRLVETITEKESMRLDGDKLIWTMKDGMEVSYHRDDKLQE